MKGVDAGRDGSGLMPALWLLHSCQAPEGPAAMHRRPVNAASGIEIALRKSVRGFPCMFRPDRPPRHAYAGDAPLSEWLA